MSYCDAKCKVYQSKYREDIHKKVLEEHWTYKQIEQWLSSVGEPISDASISRHFRNHVFPYIENYTKADKVTMEAIQNKIKNNINTLDKIEGHLRTLEQTLNGILTDREYTSNPAMIREVNNTIKTIIDAMEKHEKIRKEYYPETQIDIKKIYNDFLKACDGLPIEYLDKIAENLKKMGY